MEFLIGLLLALVVAGLAATVGLDRDRAFYPTVLMVIASYYVLFAVMGGSMQALMIESIAMTAFIIAAVIGFKFNPWIVVLGLVGFADHELEIPRRHAGEHVVVELLLSLLLVAGGQARDVALVKDRAHAETI